MAAHPHSSGRETKAILQVGTQVRALTIPRAQVSLGAKFNAIYSSVAESARGNLSKTGSFMKVKAFHPRFSVIQKVGSLQVLWSV